MKSLVRFELCRTGIVRILKVLIVVAFCAVTDCQAGRVALRQGYIFDSVRTWDSHIIILIVISVLMVVKGPRGNFCPHTSVWDLVRGGHFALPPPPMYVKQCKSLNLLKIMKEYAIYFLNLML